MDVLFSTTVIDASTLIVPWSNSFVMNVSWNFLIS